MVVPARPSPDLPDSPGSPGSPGGPLPQEALRKVGEGGEPNADPALAEFERQLEQGGRCVLVRARSARQLRDPLLVLEAVRIEPELVAAGGQTWLVVPTAQGPAARGELVAYLSENRGFGAPQRPFSARPGDLVAAVWYAILIAALYAAQNWGERGFALMDAGRLDAELVRGGEWWRAITALTLHLDFGHLAGNMIFGALFGVLLGQVVGGGVAWLAILAAGILGDLGNAWVRTGAHLSVGASTAVFGAVGLLVAFESMRRRRDAGGWDGGGWLRLVAPPMLGLVLLGWLGVGEGRVDVVAHVSGFLAGLALAPLLALIDSSLDLERRRVQLTCGALAVALVALGWGLALT